MSFLNNSNHEQRLTELEKSSEKILQALTAVTNLIDVVDRKADNLKATSDILAEQSRILQDSVSELGRAYSELSQKTEQNFAAHRRAIEAVLNEKSKI